MLIWRPTGLMRGFGGPQVYFALERLVDLAAARLEVDPVELRRRNLVPGETGQRKTDKKERQATRWETR